MTNFLIQEKLDGVSLALTYLDGELITASTRGDGNTGECVTENSKYIPTIPQQINTKGKVCVRGEAVIAFRDFEALPEGFSNPRNTVAGLIRSSKSQYLHSITFVAYEYHGPERNLSIKTELDSLAYLQALGFVLPALVESVDSPESAHSVYLEYDTGGRKKLPWQTDGLVLKMNSVEAQDSLGLKNGRPEYAIAIKPTPAECVTTVLGITWEMGLSGRFSPVAVLEPTPMEGGVTLRNVSLHNLVQLKEWCEKGLKVGSKVRVIRSGDVIPYLLGIVE